MQGGGGWAEGGGGCVQGGGRRAEGAVCRAEGAGRRAEGAVCRAEDGGWRGLCRRPWPHCRLIRALTQPQNQIQMFVLRRTVGHGYRRPRSPPPFTPEWTKETKEQNCSKNTKNLSLHCVCERERERERESVCVRERERECV